MAKGKSDVAKRPCDLFETTSYVEQDFFTYRWSAAWYSGTSGLHEVPASPGELILNVTAHFKGL